MIGWRRFLPESKRFLLANKRRSIALGLALLVVLVGFRYYKKGRGTAGNETLVPVTRGALEIHFKESGEIAAKNSVDIASKVSGRILKLHVQEGDRVSTNQALAIIQPGRTETERYQPSTVFSPIRGVVMRYVKGPGSSGSEARFAKIGDYVAGLFESNSPTYLMTIADLSNIVVELKISEMDVLKLNEKMQVTVQVDALQDSSFPGKIDLISPQAERDPNGLKVFRVQLALNRSDQRLRPGMTARVDALLEKKDSVLKIPLAALFEEMGRNLVYIHNSQKPRQAKVEIGLRTETEVEVSSGLSEKEKVYTEKPQNYIPLPKSSGD